MERIDRSAGPVADSLQRDNRWDHGVFIPLKVTCPDSDIPVVAMSLTTGLDPAAHRTVGHALAPLRDDGVLRQRRDQIGHPATAFQHSACRRMIPRHPKNQLQSAFVVPGLPAGLCGLFAPLLAEGNNKLASR